MSDLTIKTLPDVDSRVMIIRLNGGDAPLFLSILCTAFRPKAFFRHMDSILQQSRRSVEQVTALDYGPEGSGLGWVAESYVHMAQQCSGQYAVIVGDDDDFSGPDALADLQDAVRELDYPDVIVCSLDIDPASGHRWILPDAVCRTERRFIRGRIAPQCIVAKTEIVREHVHHWRMTAPDDYSIDVDYMDAILNHGRYRVEWTSLLLFRMQQRGLKRPEA